MPATSAGVTFAVAKLASSAALSSDAAAAPPRYRFVKNSTCSNVLYPTSMCTSQRPGRTSAGSSASLWFVVITSKRPPPVSMPSSTLSRPLRLTVFFSAALPLLGAGAAPREESTASVMQSTSSITTMTRSGRLANMLRSSTSPPTSRRLTL